MRHVLSEETREDTTADARHSAAPEAEDVLGKLGGMNAETLKIYGPCPTHQLWHDIERKCFECVCELYRLRTTLEHEKPQNATEAESVQDDS